MESQVLELQELPETDEQLLEPMMCCDTGHHSFEDTDLCAVPSGDGR
ncbi:hypothetical protein [Streptomyces sp. NBC_01477]|nr:hypothetical protein [Streptomyces sp. NBC_01477]